MCINKGKRRLCARNALKEKREQRCEEVQVSQSNRLQVG